MSEEAQVKKVIEEHFTAALRAVNLETDQEQEQQLFLELAIFLQWLEPMLKRGLNLTEALIYPHGLENELREDVALQADNGVLKQLSPAYEDGYYIVDAIID